MKKLLFATCFIPLLIACVDVPMTTIRVPTARGNVVIKAPKDSKIGGLKANFEKETLSLDSYEARMNPDVVSASAAGQVELIKAFGEMANGMAQLGLRAFAASQGIPIGNSSASASQPTQQITPAQLNDLVQRRAEELMRNATNRPPVQ